MYNVGIHETRCAFVAHVINLRTLDANNWILTGYIKHENVCYIHQWTLDGVSISGNTKWDIIGTIDAA